MSGFLSRRIHVLGFLLLSVLATWAVGSHDASAATQTVTIASTLDDAVERGDNVRGTALAGMRVWVWQDTAANTINYRAGGVRFAGVSIPQGSTVNSATLRLTINAGGSDDISATIWGHRTDNAPDFSAIPYILATVAEPNGRPRTTANVPVSLPNMGTGARDFTVTGIVQEIVSRPGWQPGNALALLLIPGVGVSTRADFNDVSSGFGNTAQLILDYTPPSITLAEHGSGQIPDQFTTFPTVNDAPLFRFRLTNSTGAPVTVDQIAFRLTAVWKVFSSDVTDLRINNGTVDVATGGLAAIGGRTGTLYFGTDWTIPASSTVDYTVTGDVKGLAAFDAMSIGLAVADITLASGTKGGAAPTKARHVADGPIKPLLVHSDEDVLQTKYSLYNGSAWTAPATAFTAVNRVNSHIVRTRPDYGQQVAISTVKSGTGSPDQRLAFWDGTNWDDGAGAPFNDSYYLNNGLSGTVSTEHRHVDAAYETLSQRLLVVFGYRNVGSFRYSLWNGSSWTVNQASQFVGGSHLHHWTKLAAIPNTNRIALAAASDLGGVMVGIWDGDANAWDVGDTFYFVASGANITGECVDVGVVRAGTRAGEAVAVYGAGTSVSARVYRTNDASPSWTTTTLIENPAAGNINWVRLEPNPRGDDMLLAVGTSTGQVRTYRYDGDTRTWGSASGALTSTAYGDLNYNRPFDVAWESASGPNDAVLVYSDATGIRSRTTVNGGVSWSLEQTLDGTRQAYWVRMEAEPNGFIHMAAQDQNDDLQTWTRFDGTWTYKSAQSTGLELYDDFDGVAANDHGTEPLALSSFPAEGSVKTYYRSIGTAADYSTGTVTIASVGSTTVTGTGTTWLASNRGRGDRITIGANNYVILRVDSNTQLTLTSPAVATATNSAYTIARQFTTLQDWEDCATFAVPCTYFPVESSSLVADNRSEVGIAYKDSVFTFPASGSPVVRVDGTTTDPAHTITLTADGANRHYGVPSAGVVLDNTGNPATGGIYVFDDHVTIEWLELRGGGNRGLSVGGQIATDNLVNLRNLIVHGIGGSGHPPRVALALGVVSNNFVHTPAAKESGTMPDSWHAPGAYIHVLNNTVRMPARRRLRDDALHGAAPARTTPARSLPWAAFCGRPGSISPASSNNFAHDATGTLSSPAGGGLNSVPASGAGGFNFVNGVNGNLHLQATSVAINGGANLAALMTSIDIDAQMRSGAWDIGADEYGATTAVSLMSFEAWPSDGAVDLVWRTGSEVDNLGFHLYRGLSADGPWTRLTSSLVPGQGFSATGAAYAWRDSGPRERHAVLLPSRGRRHEVRLDLHGPVSAVPRAGATPAPPPSEGGGSGGGSRLRQRSVRFHLPLLGSRPAWLLGFLHLQDPR